MNDNNKNDDSSTHRQIVTVITSPGVPSQLLNGDENEDAPLCFVETLADIAAEETILVCQGATLPTTQEEEKDDTTRTCLAVCGRISQVLVLEGITRGDVTSGILSTRHARTLSHLFQSPPPAGVNPQPTILLAITTTTSDDEEEDEDNPPLNPEPLVQDIRTLFQVVATTTTKLEDVYHVQIVPISSSQSLSDVIRQGATVSDSAASSSSSELKGTPLWSTIRDAVRDVGVSSHPTTTTSFVTLDVAQIMATIREASLRQIRTVRAKVAMWKSRIARGLLMDGFGTEATELRQRILTAYDTDTRLGAGVAMAAPYRYETRQQLQTFLDSSIQQAFTGQVSNLEKLTLKRFNAALLQTVDNNNKESAESVLGRNAATMRKEALLFETVMEDLEVPALGLIKDKPIRDLATKLNNALNAFPDSPAAKLKRLQQVTKVVNKEKQPGQRSISFGLDLVAMLRPDGFGSLQGFAGYQLPGGNSVTFGVHNDADDPQVIAQFGGVRPPLLRVQPKLKVDVEM